MILEPVITKGQYDSLSAALKEVYVLDPESYRLSDNAPPTQVYVLNTPDVIRSHPKIDREWWVAADSKGVPFYTTVPQTNLNGSVKAPAVRNLLPSQTEGELVNVNGSNVWHPPMARQSSGKVVEKNGMQVWQSDTKTGDSQ